MSDDLGELERKIAQAKGESRVLEPSVDDSSKSQKPSSHSGAQAGLEFVFCIAFASFLGYKLDDWTGKEPLFLISLFFFGVCAGFWSLYKYSIKTSKRP